MGKKISYKVQNWSSYNKSLVNRGNITLWFCDEAIKNWYAQKSYKRGRPSTYSDGCIEVALTLRSLFHFPLRATQGFLIGLIKMLQLDLKVPHYSRLSRRSLNVKFNIASSGKPPKDVVVDSTGLKIFGEGEWKMRTHGKDKRRTWRKLHLAVDGDSFQILSMQTTAANVHDDQVMASLLKEQKNLKKVFADGAYISKSCFDAIAETGAKAMIDLRSGTSTVDKKPSPGQKLRNELVQEIWNAGGKADWKKESGYHKRSLVETQMFRFKTILGGKLSERLFDNQIRESQIKVKILNRMTALGMPKSCKSM